MSTCPIYLDECNALRVNDSLLIQKQDSIIINAYSHISKLDKEIEGNRKELIKRRVNVYKYSIISGVIGFIISIFVL